MEKYESAEWRGRPHRQHFEHLLDPSNVTFLMSRDPSPSRLSAGRDYLDMLEFARELPEEYRDLADEEVPAAFYPEHLDLLFKNAKAKAAGKDFQAETKRWRDANGEDANPLRIVPLSEAAAIPELMVTYTWSQGIFHGNHRNDRDWLASRIVVMDLDDGTTEETALEWLQEAGITPWFVYRSGSWTPEKHRYRVGILLSDYVIGSCENHRALATWVFDEVFRGRPDPASKIPSQAWLGGREVILANDDSCAWDPSPIVPELIEPVWRRGGKNRARDIARMTSGFAREGFAFDPNDLSNLENRWEEEIREATAAMIEEGTAGFRAPGADSACSHLEEYDGTPPTTRESGESSSTPHGEIPVVKRNGWRRELRRTCRLFADMIEGPEGPEARSDRRNTQPRSTHFPEDAEPGWLYHAELLHLLMNLVHVSGGEAVFMAALDDHPIYATHGRGSANYRPQAEHIRSTGMRPSRCRADRCRHHQCCPNSSRSPHWLLSARVPVRIAGHEEDRLPLADRRAEAQRAFGELVAMEGITILQADTGVGKTETMLRYLAANLDAPPILIVVPTHALKLELQRRARELGVGVAAQPDPPNLPAELSDVLDGFYAAGDIRGAYHWMRQREGILPEITRFFEEGDAFRTEAKQRHAIITHKRYVGGIDSADGDGRLILVDEDPTASVLPQGSISSNLVLSVCDEYGDVLDGCDAIRNFVGKLRDCECILPIPPEARAMLRSLLQLGERVGLRQVTAGSDVISFLLADHACLVKGDIAHIRRNELPSQNTTILSAKLGEWFARNVLFPGRDIHHERIGPGEMRGRVIQDAGRTYSGTNIRDHFDEIRGEIPHGFRLICHKSFAEELGADGHFGAVEGLDWMAGEDLCVLGTHRIPPHCHALMATAAGLLEPGSKMPLMQTRFVDHDGWRFKFHCFQDEDLRQIQLHTISSSLHQAVGRARVLEHDCVVLVKSNYPVQGAEMIDPSDVDVITEGRRRDADGEAA